MSFTIVGFSPKRFLVSIFPAFEKFDSDLVLDAWSFLEFWNPLGRNGFKAGWEKKKHKTVTKKKTKDSWEPMDTLKEEENKK